MKAIINKITEYNNKSMRNVKNTRKELDNDIKIEVVMSWTIKGDAKEHREVLASLEIHSYTITQEELKVLVESLKMVYSNHPDGEIKMYVIHNHEYLNC
jgi:hypothetical protein